MIETAETLHPYNHRYEIPEATKVLIVGTAPPPRFFKRPWSPTDELDFDFYYGSGANWMWGILPEALGKTPLAESLSSDDCAKAARELLEENALWMHDVLEHVRRKSGHESSALDSHIETPTEKDFAHFGPIFDRVKDLRAIATTSQYTFNWLIKALQIQGFISGDVPSLKKWEEANSANSKDEDGVIVKHKRPAATFKLPDGRILNVYILPSPSSARGMRPKLKVEVYRHVLNTALSAS